MRAIVIIFLISSALCGQNVWYTYQQNDDECVFYSVGNSSFLDEEAHAVDTLHFPYSCSVIGDRAVGLYSAHVGADGPIRFTITMNVLEGVDSTNRYRFIISRDDMDKKKLDFRLVGNSLQILTKVGSGNIVENVVLTRKNLNRLGDIIESIIDR